MIFAVLENPFFLSNDHSFDKYACNLANTSHNVTMHTTGARVTATATSRRRHRKDGMTTTSSLSTETSPTPGGATTEVCASVDELKRRIFDATPSQSAGQPGGPACSGPPQCRSARTCQDRAATAFAARGDGTLRATPAQNAPHCHQPPLHWQGPHRSGKVRVLNTTPPRGLMVVLTDHHSPAQPQPDNETPC